MSAPKLPFNALQARVGDISLGTGLANIAAISSRAIADLGLTCLGSLRPWSKRRSSRSTRKRIAFQAYSVHLARIFSGAIHCLRDRPGIDIRFVLLPHPQFPRRDLVDLRHYVRTELGLPDEAIQPHWRTHYEEIDLLVCADVYARFPRRSTRTCLIAHGPGLTKRFFDPNPLRKTVADFDVVAVNGPYDSRLVWESALSSPRPGRIRAVGLPYLDELLTGQQDRAAYCRRHGFDAARRIVVYAPHWLQLNRSGSWYRVCDTINNLVRAGVSVLIKPHYCSLKPAMSRGVDWRARFAALAAGPTVSVDYDSDDTLALGSADAIVTDRSSRAFNAMLAGVPVVVLNESWCDGTDPLGSARQAMLRRGAAFAGSASEISRYLQSSSGAWRANPEARRVADQCFAYPGCSGEAFARLIGEEIGIAAHRDTAGDIGDATGQVPRACGPGVAVAKDVA